MLDKMLMWVATDVVNINMFASLPIKWRFAHQRGALKLHSHAAHGNEIKINYFLLRENCLHKA